MQNYWSLISEKLEHTLESGAYKVWIASAEGDVQDGRVVLSVCSDYAGRRIQGLLGEAICAAAREVLGRSDITLECRVASRASVPSAVAQTGDAARAASGRAGGISQSAEYDTAADGAQDVTPPPAAPLWSGRSAAQGRNAQGAPLPVGLPPIPRWRHSFDDFVVGDSNTVAVAAAQDMCRPSAGAQTLFVSAASGLGKTHLMQAVGRHLGQGAQLGYLTAEEFTSRFMLAVRSHQMDAFKESLRSLDMLLLEDVHFFQGKEKTQEEVLATIKALCGRGGRVLLTSAFAPRDLQHMDSQLLSYFSSGMLTLMDAPTLEMRCRILQNKAHLHQVLLPDDVTDAIASRLTTDVRQLESCLQSLLFKARHLHKEVCLDMALEVLGQYATVAAPVTFARITELVCQCYKLKTTELFSRSRKQAYVLARNTLFFLARKHTDLSLQEIGEKCNRRHSTVISGITSLDGEIKRQSRVGRQLANSIQLIEKNAGLSASL